MRIAKLPIAAAALLTLLVLALGLAPAALAARAAAPQTFKVMVGAGDVPRGVEVMAYFPDSIRIHVGDRVRWVQNTNEIHTVTFLGGSPLPDFVVPAASLELTSTPSPLVFNPRAVDRTAPPGGLGDTTTFVNSGLMGREPGQFRHFDLTFTGAGTYNYLCSVHGTVMSGTIKVLNRHAHVASPSAVLAAGRVQIASDMAKAPAVIRAAKRAIKPPSQNPDGSMTRYVSLGYSKGQIDLMQFFPGKLTVRPGDTVTWEMTPASDAPHTVTFLNGQPEPALVIPVPQPSGPPVLYINPATLFPSLPSPDLTRTGLYNAGLMNPIPGTTFSLKVGDVTPGALPFLCLLHDTSGMKGTLMVKSR